MKTRIWLIAAAALVFVVAPRVSAQEAPAPPTPPRDILKQADANGDGKVTFEEFSAAQPSADRKTFDQLDKNKDGVISQEDRLVRRAEPPTLVSLQQADKDGDGKITLKEAQAVIPGMTQEKFAVFDRDKDGVVSKDELPKLPALPSPPHPIFARFREADKDGNGKVTLEEAQAVVPDITKEKFSQLDKNGDGVLSPEDQPSRRIEPPLFGLLQAADKNGDGKVTLEEAQAAMPDMTKERFTAADRNGDGVFTSEDIVAARPVSPLITRLLQGDKDGDGKVTFEEAQTVMPKLTQERFLTFDRNGDGVITRDDNARGPATLGPMPSFGRKQNRGQTGLVRKADSDGDGKVTFEEMQAFRSGISKDAFDRLDTDGDGVITEKDEPVRPTGPGTPVGPKDSVAGDNSGLVERMAGADADGDGKTTRQEAKKALPNMPASVFDRLDTNKDGVISKEDAQQQK